MQEHNLELIKRLDNDISGNFVQLVSTEYCNTHRQLPDEILEGQLAGSVTCTTAAACWAAHRASEDSRTAAPTVPGICRHYWQACSVGIYMVP